MKNGASGRGSVVGIDGSVCRSVVEISLPSYHYRSRATVR
jgi:hypothetical protein